MAFDITNTHHLLAAYEQATPVSSFLRDRYFPCNPSTDVFTTDDVIMEYKNGTQKMAPFVAPRVGGKTVLRNGYKMERYEPPFIAPKRPLTLDDLAKKGFGEAIYANLTPEQRQGAIVTKDMSEMDEMITRREEAMAAEVMTTGALVMKHYGDNDTDFEEKYIQYFEGETNTALYTPAAAWGPDADIYGDLVGMVTFAQQSGLRVSELVVASNVVPVILNNKTIKEYLDIRGYEMGHIQPRELNAAGAAYIGTLNVNGVMIDIISYAAQYEAENGTMTAYIPSNTVVLTAPAAGRTAYGAVTQLENDENFHTYAAKRVPKYTSNKGADIRTLRLAARPLMIPNNKNCFIVADIG
jgi:hypothetical protein